MLHVTKGRSKVEPIDICALEPITMEFRHWLSKPITFDHRDYSGSMWHAGWAALVLDPMIDGYYFTRVLMDGGSSVNLIYQDTVRKMGVEPTKISHSNISFKGVTPGRGTRCSGSLLLEVIFGSPDNFRSEKLTFYIAPFKSGYQALLGRDAFACVNAIPHYASLTLKMPGPQGIISVKGNIERSLHAKDCAAALTATH